MMWISHLTIYRTMTFMSQHRAKFGHHAHGHPYNRFTNIFCHLSFGTSHFGLSHKQVSDGGSEMTLNMTITYSIFRFFLSVEIPLPYQHISSMICGLALSYFTLGTDFLYSLTFTGIEYILLLVIHQAKNRQFGTILLAFCLAVLVMG